MRKCILYCHVLNKKISEFINKTNFLTLDELLFSKKEGYTLFFDDSHISSKNYINKPGIYYPIIGRCSLVKSKNNNIFYELPSPKINLQSALFHSLSGNNNYFLNINDIPKYKILNHTYNHTKYNISNKIIGYFDKKNPYNWHIVNTNKKNDYNIYENNCLHLKDYKTAYEEIYNVKNKIEKNLNIVIAPWNKINDDFIKAAKDNNIDYIIYNDILDLNNMEIMRIQRINIERNYIWKTNMQKIQ